MKIVVANIQIPFLKGGAEYHAENLTRELIKRGHEAEIVTMPFMDDPPHKIENQILAARLLDLSVSWGGWADLMIGLRFPAYLIPHPNKVIWALHQYRQAYELFDTEYSQLKDDPAGREIRDIIRKADSAYLPEAKRIYANSRTVSQRMMLYNNVASIPLYHPCPDMEKFYPLDYGDYILMPSRISRTKRQHLAVEAMRYVKSGINLLILGSPDNDEILKELQDRIRELRLEDRVRFSGFVSAEEKLRLYARARAVLFIPREEDYGYITLEAMASARPVITAADSGGPLEFVLDSETGIVTEPEPKEIAQAIDRLAKSPALAEEMGKAGKAHLAEMDVSWDHVVKELTK